MPNPRQVKNQQSQPDMASSKKDKLKDLASVVALVDPKEAPAPSQAKPQTEVKPVATGSISKICCFFLNLVLRRKKWKELNDQQVQMLSQAFDDIETQYCPAVLSKYGEKWAPLANLSMALFMVYSENKPGEPKENQEKPQENQVPAN